MELGHDAGGARIEQSRKKTCSTLIAWPQCAQTKVGRGESDPSSAAASGGGDLGFGSQDLSVDLGAYARKVTNPPGQHVFPRTDTGIDIVQACLKYRGPDLA